MNQQYRVEQFNIKFQNNELVGDFLDDIQPLLKNPGRHVSENICL